MTTLSAHGGGAQPASIDTSGKVTGGAALRVYGFDSEADATAAGYVCEGGPAMSVAIITDAQIASGAWKAEGDPKATAIYTAPATMPVEGGYAVPVYPVNGWGSATPPAPVPPQVASATLLLDLRASQLALTDGDPVSLWSDASGLGHDFTQTGTARPIYNVVGGVPQVTPDGSNDWMLGENFADNLDQFAVFVCSKVLSKPVGGTGVQIMKMNGFANPPGWGLFNGAIYLESGALDYIGQGANNGVTNAFAIISYVHGPRGTLHVYVNGVEDSTPDNFGTFDQFSNSQPVTLFTDGQTTFNDFPVRAFLIYQINDLTTFQATDRAAIETWLGTNP